VGGGCNQLGLASLGTGSTLQRVRGCLAVNHVLEWQGKAALATEVVAPLCTLIPASMLLEHMCFACGMAASLCAAAYCVCAHTTYIVHTHVHLLLPLPLPQA
jgi:hypothetical protein